MKEGPSVTANGPQPCLERGDGGDGDRPPNLLLFLVSPVTKLRLAFMQVCYQHRQLEHLPLQKGGGKGFCSAREMRLLELSYH